MSDGEEYNIDSASWASLCMYTYSLHSISVEQATINAKGGIGLIRFTPPVVPGPGIRLALIEQSFVPVPVQVISFAAVTDSKRSGSLACVRGYFTQLEIRSSEYAECIQSHK